MNIIQRGKAFVQGLKEVAGRSAWDWRRCPKCGDTLTVKNGGRWTHPSAGGWVVGINAMVTGPGIALAVPSQVAQRFLEGEPAGRAWFGIEVYGVELPPLLAEPLGISAESGLLVHSVEDGSPAEGAGVMLGDLLVALDGGILRGTEDLAWRLAGAEPGRPVRVTLLRGGKLLDLVATPTSRR